MRRPATTHPKHAWNSWRPAAARAAVLGLVLLLAAAAALALPQYKKSQKQRIVELPETYRTWLLQVEVLISDEEFETFMGLEKDYQRDAFIDRFWRERDPYPDTARNEYKERWHDRAAFVSSRYGMDSEPGRMFMLNGEPDLLLQVECPIRLHPMEVWFYEGSDRVGFQFVLVFYKREGTGPWRLFHPFDGIGVLFDRNFLGGGNNQSIETIRATCRDGDLIARGIGWVLAQGPDGFALIQSRIEKKPDPPDGEWVATFNAYSTELPEGAGTFEAGLQVGYPGRQQSRTVVQGVFQVPLDQVSAAELGGYESYNFVLNGEMLRDGELFEAFRYKFDFPLAEVQGDSLPMVFQRTARPGTYTLIVKLEDLNSKRFFRDQRTVVVPKLDHAMPAPPPDDPISARLLREANDAITDGETTLKLVRPAGELLSGLIRFETLSTGEPFGQVTFYLDDKPILTKRRPPFSVELDVGSLPRTRVLRVAGFDEGGEEMASDELLINAGGHRFSVRLVEPRRGKTYHESLQAAVEVNVPDGRTLERVEVYLNETLVATLFQPPWVQPVLLPPDGATAYVRAVAYLTDGNSTEDLVFVNAPDYLDEVDIQYVELYTTVLDREGRPVQNLSKDQLTVFEDGAQQTVLRFEQVRDRPYHAGILLDVSASMDDSLDEVQKAALAFFETAVAPKDRAALVTFNDRPHLAVKFSNDSTTLSGGLAGLKAERGTALYDSLIFTLYYFNGIRGQKAILVLSDGKDESSRFSFEDALEYAQRSGVTLYAIGLKEAAKDGDSRKKLTKLADQTGGRAFFLDDAGQLAAIYAQIQEELRSQYLLTYQSTNSDGNSGFRTVEVKTGQRGLEVKTLSGYYP